MVTRQQRIQKLADALIDKNKITAPPIPIKKIIRAHGLQLAISAIPNSDISGFLLREKSRIIIGINAKDVPVRQRFTMAHELGHYLLHPNQPDELHVDRGGWSIQFRNSKSSLGTDNLESEANTFAAELLMPRIFLAKDLEKYGGQIDLFNDTLIRVMAQKYDVSRDAMRIRLGYLGML